MHRISSHTDEELAALEDQAEALMVSALQLVMDQIANRIIEHASVPVMAAGPPEDVPGQPYVSPDDLSSITPLWREQVARMLPLIAEIYNESGGRVHAGLVEAARLPGLPDAASAAASGYLGQVQNVYEGISSDLWETARGELVDGFNNGESIDQLAARLRSSASMTARRATLVARSTVIEASNAGSIATAKASGLDMQKEWIATNDPRTRPTHRTADGQRVDLHASFTVGGFSAEVPGDPGLPAQEKYNCRCTVGYVMADDQAAAGRTDAKDQQAQAELPGTQPEGQTTDQVERRIFNAYEARARHPGDLVKVTDLRNDLPDVGREEFDRAALQAGSRRSASLIPNEQQAALTQADHEAAVLVHGREHHLMAFQQGYRPPRGPSAAESIEQAARTRQAQIDVARGYAELISEADEQIANQASARAFASRLKNRATANGLPRGVADELIAAHGDAAQLDLAIDRIAAQQGLTRNTARAGQVVQLDRASMDVIGPTPDSGVVLVVRPGYTATVDGEQLQVFRATVQEASADEAAAFRAAQGQSLAESTAVERRARREAARSRNREIEAAKAYADLASSVDQLIAQRHGVWSDELGRNLDQLRIAARQAGIPQDELIALSNAINNESVGHVRLAANQLAAQRGLSTAGRVGARVAYNPETMEPVGDVAYEVGQQVQIWRVGQNLTLSDGSSMVLDKTIVRSISGELRTAKVIMRDAHRAMVKGDRVAAAALDEEIAEPFIVDFGDFRTSISSSYASLRSARVDGLILNRDGQQVGTFIRSFRKDNDGKLLAHHSSLQLDPQVQGSGFAARFNARMFDYYRRSGVDRVTVFANDDIGGYTWAAQGFDFADSAAANHFRMDVRSRIRNEFAGPNLSGAAHRMGVDPQDLDDQVTAFEALLARAENGEHITAQQFSQLGRKPGQGGRDAMWLGKKLMLGLSWNGVLPL